VQFHDEVSFASSYRKRTSRRRCACMLATNIEANLSSQDLLRADACRIVCEARFLLDFW
jgi:hypothetical protein